MRIITTDGKVPSQFIKSGKDNGSDVYRTESFLGVKSVLSMPTARKADGFLDPKCEPWEFELFHFEFRNFLEEEGIGIEEVSVRQCIFGSDVLVPQVFDGDYLGISVVNLGDGRFTISSICRGENPIRQHMMLWRGIIRSDVNTDELIDKVNFLGCD